MPITLLIGIAALVFTLLTPPPPGLSPEAWVAAGMAMLMVVWWLTEAVPLAVTALVPLAIWPVLSGSGLEQLSTAYAHPLIFLFLGGFLLAGAIERWGLHRRIAHMMLGLAGSSPKNILAAMMAVTAFLSLWISNTAAAMIMAPIAMAVAGSKDSENSFATALMLGVAFSATIGGMGSLIGTPPNAIFAAYMHDVHGIAIGFAQWAIVGIPVAIVLLGSAWMILSRKLFAHSDASENTLSILAPGSMTKGEARVALVAISTALAWMTRPLFERLFPGIMPSDPGIAMISALLLFLLPAGDGRRLLDWPTAVAIRWDVLILFGGGLALAQIVEQTGLAGWIGLQAIALDPLPIPLLIVAFAAIIVYLGELASNTAMAAIFLPIAGAAAITIGIEPMLIALPIALAASVGFMLPVATPPNAIVFSHPAVTRRAMLDAGAPLDVIGILVATGLGGVLGILVF